ncbi:MAG TPA: SAF domain-containing protein [Microthrixaceae bacterium]|nr:SAF domain-containing protein [Microthrixaceae bacterium]
MWSWMVAVALATTTGVVVHRTLAAAEAGADRYGSPRSVVMPNRELAAGQVVGDEDVTVTVVPASSAPAQALRRAPIGRALTAPAHEGQALVEAQVAAPGVSGLAASLGDRQRAVAVPRGDHPLPLDAGDVVDVLAPDATTATMVEVATGARVLEVSETTVAVAVDDDSVSDVATALVGGAAVLTLSSG